MQGRPGRGWAALGAGALLATVSGVAPAAAVSGGTTVDAATFTSTWSFTVKIDFGTGFCTGSLVAADEVLTSKDCTTPTDVSAYTVYYGSPYVSAAQHVGVKSIDRSSTTDVALLHLAGSATGVTPMPIVGSGQDTLLTDPVSASFAGFGSTSTQGAPGQLSAATVSVSRAGVGWQSSPGGAVACNGDSGGPLVATVDGSRVLLGLSTEPVGDGSLSCLGSLANQWLDIGNDPFVTSTVLGTVTLPPPSTTPPTSTSTFAQVLATVTPTSGTAPLTVTFDLSRSTSPDGSPLTYTVDPTYDLATGTWSTATMSGTSSTVTHTYTEPGTYTAAMQVTANGQSALTTTTITVTAPSAPPPPPPAPATLALHYTTSAPTGPAPLTVSFDLSGSTSSDGAALVYALDPLYDPSATGPSAAAASGPDPRLSYTYTEAGTYQARVSVYDPQSKLHDSAIVPITVTPTFTFAGFSAPVATDGTTSVRAGSVLPLRWSLTEAGTVVDSLDAIAAGYPLAEQVGCSTRTDLGVDGTASPGRTVLRYDTGSGQYVWNWKAPRQPGTCWSLDMRLSDGTDHVAVVRLR